MTIEQRQRPSRRALVLLLTSMLTAPAIGCGGDETTNSGLSANNDSSPAHNDQPGDGSGLDPAATVEVKLTPARSVYKTGATLTPRAVVYNGHGETISGATVEWQVEPPELFSQTDAGYRLEQQGALRFEACTTDEGARGEAACGQKQIFIDDHPPAVELIQPRRGAWLGEDGAQSIVVEGQVMDTHDALEAFVNGQRVDLDNEGRFLTSIVPEFGINHIAVSATDGLSRASGEAMVDVLWAPDWYPMNSTASTISFGFEDGLVLALGQRFFDDGQAPSQPDETTLRTEDLADVFALLIQSVDFMDQIPDPVLDNDAGTLRITALTMGEPQVVIELTDEGAELFIWVPSLDVRTRGALTFEQQVLDLTGSVDAAIVGYARIDLDKPGRGQDFIAEVGEVDISIQGAEAHFASPEANAIFELAESALRATIEEMLVGTLQAQFVDALPDLLANALNSVEAQLTGVSFDLNTAFTRPMTLTLDGVISGFEMTFRDALRATIAAEVSTAQPPVMNSAPGIPLASAHTDEAPLFETSRAQVAVRLGLLNGLLHGLWESGFLEIDLTELIPADYAGLTENATLSTKLQPVLSPPTAGQPYDFILRAGQMEIEVEILNQTDVYVVNIEVGILMSLDNNAIAVQVPDEPAVTAWVQSTSGDSAVLGRDVIEELILGQVWPQVEETLRQGLSFELPVPQLTGLADMAPTMTALEFAFLLERPVAYRDGFVIFDTMLEGSLPLAP